MFWNGHCAVHGDGVSFFKVRLDDEGVVITCSMCAYQNATHDLREARAKLAIQVCKNAKGESKGESNGEGKNEGKGRSQGKDPWPLQAIGESNEGEGDS